MEQERIDALLKIDVDYEGAMRRFCSNDEMYEKFLLKFLSDPNYSKIRPAFENGKFDDALIAAHTHKGVSANLGLNSIFRICAEIVDNIRADEPKKAMELLPALDMEYERVCSVIADKK